ncbi:MAG: thiamine phosphate synthase [Lachnospiraceae bacterium]|jgi:thiamine-phosphate pyrophosphorylase|nr:thiamine phosphate synthase [Clostridia bacterium]MBQ7175648.1 thiamine phosphate synthase [Lachnospiraceae bacterium]MBR2531759.1 thiamine phosphate synthase [Lachnospiraceae bacterium]
MNMTDYTLYLCTDRDLMSTPTLEEAVEAAIRGGVTIVQLREKNCSSREFYDTAVSIKAICDRHQVPLIINDRLDIALAVDAAGVHVGQSDLPADKARAILGPDRIIGVSTATPEEALKAKADGADYIGVGAMFATGTKKHTRPVTMERLAQIRRSVDLPIVVIGGVNETNCTQFNGTGVDGLAVVSAIIAKPDIEAAARELRSLFRK